MDGLRYYYRGTSYRESLLTAALEIEEFLFQLKDRIMEITMTGELKAWSDSVPDGETHVIEMEVFEGINDPNVAVCVHLHEKLELNYEWLIGINYISQNELDAHRIKRMQDRYTYPPDLIDDKNEENPELPF